MKILKIIGVVAGVHALALLIIFANPGCSSTSKVATPSAEPAKAQPTPSISTAALNSAPPISASPVATDTPNNPAFNPDAAATPDTASTSGIRYSPTRPNTSAAAAVEQQPVADVTPASTYTVGNGDSLWSVAKRNHLRVSDLAAANGLRTTAVIRPGQKLLIPSKGGAAAQVAAEAPAAAPSRAPAAAPSAASAPAASEGSTYTVKNGETLGMIAKKLHVKTGALAKANNLTDPRLIRPGQTLIVPSASSSQASATRPAPAAAPAGPITPAPASTSEPDLDSGLKSTGSADIPTIKVDPNK